MEDHITIQIRKYVGKGILRFDGITIECDFEFMFRNDGKSRFEAVFYITNDNGDRVLDLIRGNKILLCFI
jgi:hypothetical protein